MLSFKVFVDVGGLGKQPDWRCVLSVFDFFSTRLHIASWTHPTQVVALTMVVPFWVIKIECDIWALYSVWLCDKCIRTGGEKPNNVYTDKFVKYWSIVEIHVPSFWASKNSYRSI